MKYLTLFLLLSPLIEAGIIEDSNTTRALRASASRNRVSFNLLKSICFIESNLKEQAMNKFDGGSASYGLCQIKLSTARSLGFRGHIHDLYNPYINTNYAAKYLRYQLDRYEQDWIRAIAAYNKGSATLPISNTKYVTKVVRHYMRLQ